MMQKEFAQKVIAVIQNDPQVIGLAVAGSWADDELDEFSDIDFVLVTKEKIGGNKEKMFEYARSFGDFISGFTGDHVGEPRLLVCLYDNPLLHVDIKFVTLKELEKRVDNPVVLFERGNKLTEVISSTKPEWPDPDFQWIEDRIWTWVHYIAAKIGRGEFFEAMNGIEYIRANVLAPLMQVKGRKKARGLRKVENKLSPADLENLKITVAQYTKASLVKSLDNIISIYRSLRRKLYTDNVQLQEKAEKKSVAYFKQLQKP